MSAVEVAAPRLEGRRVLVVEDDATVREVVGAYLRAAGFRVHAVGDGLAALQVVESFGPDLVVLDRLLPGIEGLEAGRRLRRLRNVPLIVLTALDSVEDRIEGLEAGVDDYVTKPFSARELVLRVQSVLRRTLREFEPESPFDQGDFHLDPAARTVRHRGRELAMASREFDLLAFFLRHPNQVFTREQLLRAVWHWEFGDLSTVTVHVRRVREKIEDDVTDPRILLTVWGVGYRLKA